VGRSARLISLPIWNSCGGSYVRSALAVFDSRDNMHVRLRGATGGARNAQYDHPWQPTPAMDDGQSTRDGRTVTTIFPFA
jgi:hypothetical protein